MMIVDGKSCEAVSRASATILNPANGSEIGRVPEGDGVDVDRAVAAANDAFPE